MKDLLIHRIPACFLFLWIAVASASSQQAGPTASIEGRVLRADTREPIAGAQLTLKPTVRKPGALPFPSVTADNLGHYAIENLDPGLYQLSAASNGYVKQEFGQQNVRASGAPILLTEGQHLKNVEIRLTPAGTLSGHIRNPNGRPLAGIPVHLVRRSYDASGERSYSQSALTTTDDRGEYRFYWATPGRYLVVAGLGPENNDQNLIVGTVDGNDNEIVRADPYTFFPGSIDIDKAGMIEIPSGGEVDGVDLVLATPRTYTIRARVVDPATGKAPPEASGSLGYWALGGGVGRNLHEYDANTGTVTVTGLVPGVYTLNVATGAMGALGILAEGLLGPSGPSASAQVAVSNSDVDLGVLALKTPLTFEGVVRFDTPASATSDSRLLVSLVSPTTPDQNPRRVRVITSPGESFSAQVPFDNLRVVVSELPPGFYVREARLDGADVLNATATAGPMGKLEIFVSARGGQIEGSVRSGSSEKAPGLQVVLVPDSKRDQPERFKEAISDQDGRFRISGIPPGDYKLFAWEDLERFSYFDPEILRKYDGKGQPVHVTESSGQTFNLNAIAGEGE